MKKASKLRYLLQMVVVLVAMAIAQTETALAASTITKYWTSGDLVHAEWSSEDSCKLYHFSLEATNFSSNGSALPPNLANKKVKDIEPDFYLLIWFSIDDSCTGILSGGYLGTENPGVVELNIENRTASLKGNSQVQLKQWNTLDGSMIYNSSVDMDIDLQWIANGNPERTVNHQTERDLDTMIISHYTAVTVPATLSRSISIDGTPWPQGDNVDVSASINSGVNGLMTIRRLPPTGQ